MGVARELIRQAAGTATPEQIEVARKQLEAAIDGGVVVIEAESTEVEPRPI